MGLGILRKITVLTLCAGFVFPPGGAAFAQGGKVVFPPPGLRAESRADSLDGGDALPPAPEPEFNNFSNLSPDDVQRAQPQQQQAPVNPFAPVQKVTKSPQQIEEEIRDRAFNAAITGLLPMRSGEIRTMLEKFDETQQAVEVPIYPYPKPETVVQTVSLDPGAQPPEIKLAVGHVATLTVVDVTGAPWPIQDISWAGNFEIINPETGGNILRITPMTEFAYGNMSMRLLKLNTPITFVLKTHRDSIHYRFDARVPEYGPFANVPIIEGGGFSLVAGDSILGAILDGVPPDGAARLDVDGVDGRTSAYKYEETTYVRTPLTLLSPGWSGSVSSADGMNVYAMKNAPVLLLSDKGRMVRARLSERGSASDGQ